MDESKLDRAKLTRFKSPLDINDDPHVALLEAAEDGIRVTHGTVVNIHDDGQTRDIVRDDGSQVTVTFDDEGYADTAVLGRSLHVLEQGRLYNIHHGEDGYEIWPENDIRTRLVGAELVEEAMRRLEGGNLWKTNLPPSATSLCSPSKT